MPAFDDALRTLDERFVRVHEDGRVPGVAWGVVRDGALVHTGGVGTIRDGEVASTPDADSIFRIASMTKSFTATAILLLRDEGRLRLDDPAADHVPELAGWTGPTADSPPVTIRHLLTMSAGLPTDDPWGDRQQGLALEAFAHLLAGGVTFAWAPGTQFEYSNLGYGILGRVVTAASGHEYRAFVEERVLRPLGLESTAFDEEHLPVARVAHGYMRQGDVLVREGTDGYGALASMGGLYSSVRDLATWVAGFLDAFPPRDDPEEDHPLRRAARREMQQIHRALPALLESHPAHQPPLPEAAGYGFGLFMVSDAAIGTRVSHGGGYPGFGSTMTWHPASGLGVVALGNHRYARVQDAGAEGLADLVRALGASRRPRPLPAVESLHPVVEGLLASWDDEVADRVFATNMDLDEPREARRAAVTRIAADLGPFTPDERRPVISASPAHLAWWLRGARGSVRVSMLVTPERPPRLQAVRLTPVPDPAPELVAAAEAVLAASRDGAAPWPPAVEVAPAVDVEVVRRSVQAAAARLGVLRLGLASDGDGAGRATFEVHGDAVVGVDAAAIAPASLELARDAGTGELTAVRLAFAEREAPPEG